MREAAPATCLMRGGPCQGWSTRAPWLAAHLGSSWLPFEHRSALCHASIILSLPILFACRCCCSCLPACCRADTPEERLEEAREAGESAQVGPVSASLPALLMACCCSSNTAAVSTRTIPCMGRWLTRNQACDQHRNPLPPHHCCRWCCCRSTWRGRCTAAS